MATTFTSDSLRQLFQSAFHLTEWREYLQHFFGATSFERTGQKSSEGKRDRERVLIWVK